MRKRTASLLVVLALALPPSSAGAVMSQAAGAEAQVPAAPRVSADRDFGDVVWDRGTVASDESTDIRYGGTGDAAALRPESDYWWRVTVADHRGVEAVSDVSTFSTGLMSGTIDAWDGTAGTA